MSLIMTQIVEVARQRSVQG